MLLGQVTGRATRLVALLAITAIAATACGASSTPTGPAGTETAAPISSDAGPQPSSGGNEGGTMTSALIGPCCESVDVVNPLLAYGSYQWFNKIWEHLVTYSIDPATNGYGPITPSLAASWSTSSDDLTWTFKLQPDVTWHDGTPFTSADVAFSLELCLNQEFGRCVEAASISNIVGAEAFKAGTASTLEGVKTPDPLTVEITTSEPDAAALDTMARIWIVQKSSLGAIPASEIAESPYWSTAGQAVGTGPFKVNSFEPGQFMELVRFDDYWRGRPLLEKLINRQFTDPSAALLAFDSGEIDLTYVTADELARERDNANATLFGGPGQSTNYIQQNPVRHEALANKAFVQAMSYAIDREGIIEGLYDGAGEPLNCLFGNPAYRGTEIQYTYDLEKARELIKQSGIDVASLPEFDFLTYYEDPLTLNVMTAISDSWAQIGIKSKPRQLDGASVYKLFFEDGAVDLLFAGNQNGPDGNIAAGTFGSAGAWPNGNNGFKGWFYDNEEVDQLIVQGRSVFDAAERAKVYQDICRVTADDQAFINLWQTTRYFIAANKFKNVQITPAAGGGSYYDAVETWYIE